VPRQHRAESRERARGVGGRARARARAREKTKRERERQTVRTDALHRAFCRAASRSATLIPRVSPMIRAAYDSQQTQPPPAAASRVGEWPAAVFLTIFTCFWNVFLIIGLGSSISAMFSGA